MAERPVSRRPEVEIEKDGIRLPGAWFRKQKFARWGDVQGRRSFAKGFERAKALIDEIGW